jgi:hypothetical protein
MFGTCSSRMRPLLTCGDDQDENLGGDVLMGEDVCTQCDYCGWFENGCGGQSGTFYEEACPASDQYAGRGRCE